MLLSYSYLLVAHLAPWNHYKKKLAELLYILVMEMLDLETFETQQCQNCFQMSTDFLWISGLLRPMARMFANFFSDYWYVGFGVAKPGYGLWVIGR